MSNICRTIPPYGKRTLEELQFKNSNCITVFIGRTAFAHAEKTARRPLLVIPDDKDPATFDWRHIVDARDVVLIEFGSNRPARIARAAQALLSAGANLVTAVHSGAHEVSVYRRSEEPDHVA